MKLVLALAALLAAANAATAETIRFYCQNPTPANNELLEIDFTNSRLRSASTFASNSPWSNWLPARITDYEITWQRLDPDGFLFRARVDRVTGNYSACQTKGREHDCWPDSTCKRANKIERAIE